MHRASNLSTLTFQICTGKQPSLSYYEIQHRATSFKFFQRLAQQNQKNTAFTCSEPFSAFRIDSLLLASSWPCFECCKIFFEKIIQHRQKKKLSKTKLLIYYICALNVHIFHFNDTFSGNMSSCCGMPNTCHNKISCYKIMNKLCPSTLTAISG